MDIDSLREKFDRNGFMLGKRCIPVLQHKSAAAAWDFNRYCCGHVLYRFFGYDGRLLYVGMTHNLQARCNRADGGHHARPWWPHVAFATVRNDFDSRYALYRAELRAIAAEDPYYNIEGAIGLRTELTGRPGGALAKGSASVYALADALWQASRKPGWRYAHRYRPLDEEGEELPTRPSEAWLYRKPITG